MTRLSAAQTKAVTAIRDGRVLSEAEQRDLIRRHWLECAPLLPPDCPRPLGEPHHADTDRF